MPASGSVFETLAAHGPMCENPTAMNEPKRNYKWPWFVLAAVVLFIVLAVLWVAFAAEKVEQQRDYGAPLPSSAPAR